MPNYCNVYEIYDANERFVAKGIGSELGPLLDNSSGNLVNEYSKKDNLLKGKWKVVKVGRVPVKNMNKVGLITNEKLVSTNFEKRKKSRDNEILDYLIFHLRRYDNTVLNEDPKRFIPFLRKSGFDCTYRKVLGLKHEKGRDKPFYILEVKGIERKEENND